MQVEINSNDPQVLLVKQLLEGIECNQVISMVGQDLVPYNLKRFGDDGKQWNKARVSKK